MPNYQPFNVIGATDPTLNKLRAAMALKMLQGGMSTAPIQSPLQGAARIAQALFGGMALRNLAAQQKARMNNYLNTIFGGSATPSAATSAPNPTMGIPKAALSPQPLSGQPATASPNVAPEMMNPSAGAPGNLSGGFIPGPQSSNVSPYAGAIASIESRGSTNPYQLVGPATHGGDHAYGKYQVMGSNIPSWTQEALGHSMTPQQFLADPAAQDAVFRHKFGQYANKYGPEGAARAWFAGEGGMNNPNARDVLGTTVANYARRFINNLGPTSAQAADAPQSFRAMAFNGMPQETSPMTTMPTVSQAEQALAFNGQPQTSNPLAVATTGAQQAQNFAQSQPPVQGAQLGNTFQPAPLPQNVQNITPAGQAQPNVTTVPTRPVQLPIGNQPSKAAPTGGFNIPPNVQRSIRAAVMSGDPMLKAQGFKMLGQYLAPKGYQLQQMNNGDVVAFEKGNPSNAKVVYHGGNKPTTDITNFEYSNQHPGFAQYQMGMKKAGAQNTTVTVGGQKIPDILLKDAISNSKQADSLNNQVQELTVFGEMLKNAPTGALTPATLPLQAALKQIGITVGKDVPLLQAIQAQENQLALRFRNPDSGFGLTGNTSNQDVRFLKSTVPGLEKTPEANQAIVTILIAKQRRIAQIASMKADWIFQHGNLAGWNQARDAFIHNNSMFTPEEKLTLEGLRQKSNANEFTPPSNWQFSPSRQQYRDTQGNIYNMNGQRIQ